MGRGVGGGRNTNFVCGRLVTSFTVTTNRGLYLTVLNGSKLEDLEMLA
jgi:hypothetical protein